MKHLYAHQREAIQRMRGRDAFALFMEQGTGKTRCVLEELRATGMSALILAPNGVHDVWVEEAATWCLPHRTHAWRGGTTKREQVALEELVGYDGPCLLAMNIEAVRTKGGESWARRFLLSRPCVMVVDESTRIKTPSAQQTKAAIRLGKLAARRRILSGTPATESPLDLYSQCAFLDPELLGFKSFYAFRNRYAVMRQRCFPGRRPFMEVVGYQRLDELRQRLDRFSYRITREECMDLPEKIYQKRYVGLSPRQAQFYQRLCERVRLELEQGQVTVAMALTKLLRLQQVLGGFLHYDDGRWDAVDLPANLPRLKAVHEIVDESPGKVIIWARFVNELFMLRESLSYRLGRDAVVAYHGAVSRDERQEAVRRFQEDPGCRVFIGQPRSAGLGLTLTAARTVVYYSNDYSLETRLQSEDRAHRIGTRHPVVYIDLIARGTVDEHVVKALRAKRDLAATLTGDELRAWI